THFEQAGADRAPEEFHRSAGLVRRTGLCDRRRPLDGRRDHAARGAQSRSCTPRAEKSSKRFLSPPCWWIVWVIRVRSNKRRRRWASVGLFGLVHGKESEQ